MSIYNLLQPILSDGIQNPNWVNGRILSAEDLNDERQAMWRHLQQYGRAMGGGVISGLKVQLISGSDRRLSISMGQAMNREGQILALNEDIELQLVRDELIIERSAGLFGTCEPPEIQSKFTDSGLYVLTILPASGYEGRVPQLDPEFKTQCISRYLVEGVKFRIIRLSDEAHDPVKKYIDEPDIASVSQLRNLAAHACFGTEEQTSLLDDPFTITERQSSGYSYGAIEELRSQDTMKECEVPVALIYSTVDGLQFADMWAARRRLAPAALSSSFSLGTDIRRIAEAEAQLLQFQTQLEELLARDETESPLLPVEAIAYFRYLPPAGILPLTDNDLLTTDDFLREIPHRSPEYVDRSAIYTILRMAPRYQAIDLDEREMVWVYHPWQAQKIRDDNDGAAPPPFVAFSSPHMSHMAIPRFDLARWEYSHYS